MHTYISIIYICIFTCMQWKGNMFVFLGVPKYVIAFPFFGIYQVKRGRPPKCKLFRKKLSGLDKITVNQLVSHEKEKAQCHKRKRATYNGLYKNAELKSAVMKQALEVQANLSSEFPSLVKCMHPSNVTGGFWVGLPKHFCSKQLPKENRTMVLEDEEGKEFQTKYLVEKVGLSGGWRGFSIAHKLLEGDVCVFHLVKPSKFKVYIVRRKGSDEVDVALGLLKLESSTQQIELEKEPKIFVKTRDKPLENYGMYENRISVEKTDSEFSKYLKTKYYELCCNQKSFLHENLLEGLNCKLVAGVIAETINIADAIRAAKLTTSHHSFLTWGQTLKSFKGLGMKVGFLSARLDQLMNLSMKSRRYQEARLEQINANEKKRKLEAKLVEVTEALNRLVVDIGSLEEENADRLEILFQEVASAPR
ncbi:B3 domain-containing protein Os01g0234100-like isoform X3 [Durio zibethinus]|uniref:B3 domain-containing protein Os01g0234100-like isoform X3 n=1 Tax=Durio zibethinus TaxID=66656 RepID=A0A6P5Z220_DURZI|nr:B3 domain-containing protein Os01g0234100-like isoform X3 [Durio zibethinus]